MSERILLKSWSVASVSPYAAPEMGAKLHGIAVNHPRSDLAEHGVTTSRVEDVIREDDGTLTVVTLSGSRYKITRENVRPDYEEMFPNAFERLGGKI